MTRLCRASNDWIRDVVITKYPWLNRNVQTGQRQVSIMKKLCRAVKIEDDVVVKSTSQRCQICC